MEITGKENVYNLLEQKLKEIEEIRKLITQELEKEEPKYNYISALARRLKKVGQLNIIEHLIITDFTI